MLNTISDQTGELIAASTVALRVRKVSGFYQYGADQGWNQTAVDLKHALRNAKPHAEGTQSTQPEAIGKSSAKYAPRGERAETDIRPLAPQDQGRLLDALGPAENTPNQPARDRLVAEWMLFVGLRIDEALGKPANESKPKKPGLRVHMINALVADPDTPFDHCQLDICGKYGKRRTVAVPHWLVIATQDYISNERAKAAATSRNPSPMLFVYDATAGKKDHGKALKIRRFQRIIANACKRAELTQLVEKKLPGSTQTRLVRVARHSPHDLRHSYAVNEYFAAVAMGSHEPWKSIQAQLGHKHLQTTIDTYLSWVSAHSGWGRNFKRSSVRGLAGVELPNG
jgi:integrase/recombinase XerC